MEQSWFALRVKSRREKSVTELARIAGFDSFAPTSKSLHRWSQRTKEIETPLFSGYTFCRFGRADYARVMNLPGVINAVRFGTELAAIADSEILSLRRLQETNYQVEPCSYLPDGQAIWIAEGPLKGLGGTVLQDQGRVDLVLSVTILQRSVRVRLPREAVTVASLPLCTTASLELGAVTS